MAQLPAGSRCQIERYAPNVPSVKTRSASTCPESNGRPKMLQPRAYSTPSHGAPLSFGADTAAVRVRRSTIDVSCRSVALGCGRLVADPLPHRDGAVELSTGDQVSPVEPTGVETDRAHEVANTG